MRKVAFLLVMALLYHTSNAQAPQTFPYQAVARDSFGTPIPDQLMRIRVSILDSTSGGPVLYTESDTITTDNLGMFTLNIGEGAVEAGSFSSINWASASKFLKVELDPSGGASYLNMGTSQLLSVPFAMYAVKSGGAGNVSSNQIAYGNDGKLTSDPDFTRSPNSGTRIKYTKDGKHYSVGISDSNLIDVGPASFVIPSVKLTYSDTAGHYSVNMGVGSLPIANIPQYGYFNLLDSSGNSAAVELIEKDGVPRVSAGANIGGVFSDKGSELQLELDRGLFAWRSGTSKVHGIEVDSTSFKIYSSNDDSLRSWRWPSTDGVKNQALTTVGDGWLTWTNIPRKNRFGITIDGLGDVITIGSKGFTQIPYNGTITGWTIVADQAGSCVIDVKKSSYASFPGTTSVAGTALPTLTTAQKNQDVTLSGWGSNTISAGDMFEFVVNSATTVKRVTLIIETTME